MDHFEAQILKLPFFQMFYVQRHDDMLIGCARDSRTIQVLEFQMPKIHQVFIYFIFIHLEEKNNSYILTENSHSHGNYHIVDSLGGDPIRIWYISGRHEV